MARPRKIINWDTVDKLCAMQATAEEIAAFLSIDADTLATACKRDKKCCFSDYFAQKRGTGKIALRRRQFQKAVDEGDTTMLIFLGKQYLQQADKQQQEHTGPNGGPIETRIVIGPDDDDTPDKPEAV